MSGHSKWSTIKRKKGEKDGARAKIFTKISREIIVCIKEHGPDPASNSKLAALIAKAKAISPTTILTVLLKRQQARGTRTTTKTASTRATAPTAWL